MRVAANDAQDGVQASYVDYMVQRYYTQAVREPNSTISSQPIIPLFIYADELSPGEYTLKIVFEIKFIHQ